jgi:hypothetical protein
MQTSIPSVSEGTASIGAPLDAVATIHAAPVDIMAARAASLPDGRLSHTLAATLGLIVLAAGMGAMLVAIAGHLARAIRVARLQTLDLGAWLPLP